MSARTMWKVTVAVLKIETHEICAGTKEEAAELAEEIDDAAAVLDVEWIDPEAA